MMLSNQFAIKYKQLFQRTSCALAAMLMMAMVSPASASVIWNFSGTTSDGLGITGSVTIDEFDLNFVAGGFLEIDDVGVGGIEAYSFTYDTTTWTQLNTVCSDCIFIDLGASVLPGDIVFFSIDVTLGGLNLFMASNNTPPILIAGAINDGGEPAAAVTSGAFSVETLPEPSTTALLALGLLGAGFARKRRVH
jgi:hypothetical protein